MHAVIAQDPSGAKPFSSGTLTIMPAPGDSTRPTVLDAGMLSAMARVGGGPAAFANTAELHVVGGVYDSKVTVSAAGRRLAEHTRCTPSW